MHRYLQNTNQEKVNTLFFIGTVLEEQDRETLQKYVNMLRKTLSWHTLKITKYKPPTFIISHQHSQGFESVATKTT